MSANPTMNCPVCQNASCKISEDIRSTNVRFDCPRCGSFILFGTASNFLVEQVRRESIDISVLSHNLRKMQRPDGHPVQIFEDDLKIYIDNHQLPNPQEQLDNLVLLIGNNQPNQAAYAQFTVPHLAAHIGAAVDYTSNSEPNFSWLWREIAGKNYFSKGANEGNMLPLRLTMTGWEHFEQLRHKSKDSYRAFMAMAFNEPDIATMLTLHFKEAVKRAGFDLRPLNEGQPAGLIDNQIRSAIRTAAFVVADLTHANNGAYFEAGFAEGLGVPVLYTCEASVFKEKKTHFDTNHMVTIPWSLERPHEAANLLTATIRATLPTKAKLDD